MQANCSNKTSLPCRDGGGALTIASVDQVDDAAGPQLRKPRRRSPLLRFLATASGSPARKFSLVPKFCKAAWRAAWPLLRISKLKLSLSFVPIYPAAGCSSLIPCAYGEGHVGQNFRNEETSNHNAKVPRNKAER